MFDHLIGNDAIKKFLSQAAASRQLSHALLFSGPAGVGKSAFAKTLAAYLLSDKEGKVDKETHPDFHPIRPEGKSGLHPIEQLRLMIEEVYKAPFGSHGKVFLIYEAERMQTASANAILKVLEEPSVDTTMILLAENAHEILPTIRSRLACYAFQPIAEQEIEALLKKKSIPISYAKQAQGSIGKALSLASKAEMQNLLFALLREKRRYPDVLLELEKIEALTIHDDPLQQKYNEEDVLSYILMWARDQSAREIGSSKELLFFPEEPFSPLAQPLSKHLKQIEEVRAALQRNLKFSSCLEHYFIASSG